eukprot:1146793-Pelagomonas_calceolata.AAC.10
MDGFGLQNTKNHQICALGGPGWRFCGIYTGFTPRLTRHVRLHLELATGYWRLCLKGPSWGTPKQGACKKHTCFGGLRSPLSGDCTVIFPRDDDACKAL